MKKTWLSIANYLGWDTKTIEKSNEVAATEGQLGEIEAALQAKEKLTEEITALKDAATKKEGEFNALNDNMNTIIAAVDAGVEELNLEVSEDAPIAETIAAIVAKAGTQPGGGVAQVQKTKEDDLGDDDFKQKLMSQPWNQDGEARKTN